MSNGGHTPKKDYRAPPGSCPFCQQRGKTWDGNDPQCAFPAAPASTPGVVPAIPTWLFVSDNWMCATMNRLRDIAEDEKGERGVHGARVWSDEQSCGVVAVDEGEFIVMSWYKRRGCTDVAVVMKSPGMDDSPDPMARPFRKLRLSEALRAIARSTGEVPGPPQPERLRSI